MLKYLLAFSLLGLVVSCTKQPENTHLIAQCSPFDPFCSGPTVPNPYIESVVPNRIEVPLGGSIDVKVKVQNPGKTTFKVSLLGLPVAVVPINTCQSFAVSYECIFRVTASRNLIFDMLPLSLAFINLNVTGTALPIEKRTVNFNLKNSFIHEYPTTYTSLPPKLFAATDNRIYITSTHTDPTHTSFSYKFDTHNNPTGAQIWSRDIPQAIAPVTDGIYTIDSTNELQKYDLNGSLLWRKTTRYVEQVTTDATGVYVVGADAVPGSGTPPTRYAPFVTKFDHNGNLLWDKFADDSIFSSLYAEKTQIKVTDAVYITGNMAKIGAASNIFAAKLDLMTGNTLWVSKYGGMSDYDSVEKMAVGPDGIYIMTTFNDDKIIKYDLGGTLQWVKTFNDPVFNGLSDIAITTTGISVVGTTDADKSIPGKTSKGKIDAFIATLDSTSGVVTWIDQFGTTDDDYASHIIIGADGNIYANINNEYTFYLAKYSPIGTQLQLVGDGKIHSLTDSVHLYGLISGTDGIYITGKTYDKSLGTDRKLPITPFFDGVASFIAKIAY